MSQSDEERARAKQFDYAVVIGRFQPLHQAHEQLLLSCLPLAKHTLICLGSSNSPRTPRNPWRPAEREHMIHLALPGIRHQAAHCIYLMDYPQSDDEWCIQVRSRVQDTITVLSPSLTNPKIVLVGNDKGTEPYLNWFPEWAKHVTHMTGMCSTDIRNDYFSGNSISAMVSKEVLTFLDDFKKTRDYAQLVEQFNEAKLAA